MEDLIRRVAEDLIKARYGIALTGAGMSTESGIPDYRGPKGIWTRNPEAEIKAYEAYNRFKADPKDIGRTGWILRALCRGSCQCLASLKRLNRIPGIGL